MNLLNDSAAQVQAVVDYLDQLNQSMDRMPAVYDVSGIHLPGAACHDNESEPMKSSKPSLHHEQ